MCTRASLPILLGVLWSTAAPVASARATSRAFEKAVPEKAVPLVGEAQVDSAQTASKSHGIATTADGPVAFGHGYRAAFGTDGLRFLPALGEAAPRDLPLALRFDGVERGGRRVALSGAGGDPRIEIDADALLVRYLHPGGVEERYEVLAEGLYQSFVFAAEPAGHGDLVVRLDCETELVRRTDGAELVYERQGLGGVRLGGVEGIDAAGRRVAGRWGVAGDVLELRLPASFVESAAYPLILDPLIGSEIPIATGPDVDRDPDVAFGNGRNLVVWERVFSFDHMDVLGQFVDSAGNLIGGTIPIALSPFNVFQANPSVGYAAATDRFLVAWIRQDFDILQEDLYCATVDGLGNVSAALELAPGPNPKRDPCVGGNRSGANDECLVVWQRLGLGIRAERVRALPLGPVGTGEFPVDSDNLLQIEHSEPCVSRSADLGAPWLLAWKEEDPLAFFHDYDWIEGRTVSIGGSLGSITQFSDPLLGHDAALPSCDGDGDDFLVAWEVDEEMPPVGRHDVRLCHIERLGTQLFVDPALDAAAQPFVDERRPALGFAGASSVLLTYEENGAAYDLLASSVNPFNGEACGDRQRVATFVEPVASAVASEVSGGGSTERALLAWQDQTSAANEEVLAWRFEAPGKREDLGGGCGRGGTHHTPCPIAGNASFDLHLEDSIPNATAVLVTAGVSLPIACGPCTLVPNLESVYYAVTDTHGDAAVTIPIAPNLAGVSFVSQWAIFVPSGVGACPLAPLDFSNALSTTIE